MILALSPRLTPGWEDDIVAALENTSPRPIKHLDRLKILTMLSAGQISFESAMKLLADL
jgi:hypothetical protein